MKISTSSMADDIEHHADCAEQYKSVVLTRVDVLHFEVIEGRENNHQRDQQYDEMKEDAEGIDPHHVEERFAVVLRLNESRHQSDEHAGERDQA